MKQSKVSVMTRLSLSDPPLPESVLPDGQHAPMRVLVVDDDPFTLTIMKKRLMLGGYEIATAENGIEGLERVEHFKPNLIISDWMMPEMDGREFCQRVKEDYKARSIYFILLTAKDKYEDKVAALDTGADEYLVKPCDGRELMARLRAAERILRLQSELSQSNEKLNLALTRINAELEATSEIQRLLLPLTLPHQAGYGFAAHYQPSTECSGDFYDVLPLPDGRLAIAIGDVSGHGTPSMVAMAVTHMLMHVEGEAMMDPAMMLFNLNNKMSYHLPTEQYATLFYAVLDPKTGRMVYSSAGHNPPLLADYAAGTFEYLTGCEGFPIKLIGPDMVYNNNEIQIAQGQYLVLYTDGLIEARNHEDGFYGSEELIESVKRARPNTPQVLLEGILGDLGAYTQGRQLDDDLSLLIVSRM